MAIARVSADGQRRIDRIRAGGGDAFAIGTDVCEHRAVSSGVHIYESAGVRVVALRGPLTRAEAKAAVEGVA